MISDGFPNLSYSIHLSHNSDRIDWCWLYVEVGVIAPLIKQHYYIQILKNIPQQLQ